MATHTVEFQFHTGLKRSIFHDPVLRGSWDQSGRYAAQWTDRPMDVVVGDDGCPVFIGKVELDTADADRVFQWGVSLSGPQGAHFWGVPTELDDVSSVARYRTFRLDLTSPGSQVERYFFTNLRRLGANLYSPQGAATAVLRFAVWAPNARSVDVVFGDPATGYIADDGTGIVGAPVPLAKGSDGIWEGCPAGDYADFLSRPYMYRIGNASGETVYRTDIFSRSQIGRGSRNPEGAAWAGSVEDLDGGRGLLGHGVHRRAAGSHLPVRPGDL